MVLVVTLPNVLNPAQFLQKGRGLLPGSRPITRDDFNRSVNLRRSMQILNMTGGLATAQPGSQLFEPLIDVGQMAELLHLHPKTIQARCRSGAIRAMKNGKEWLSRLSELDAYVRSQLSSRNQSRRAEEA